MRFSEAYSIGDPDQYSWFDVHLQVDTPLFVDPTLLLHNDSEWVNEHQELINHIAKVYQLIEGSKQSDSLELKIAHDMLTFPEPQEFCLGYSAQSAHTPKRHTSKKHVSTSGVSRAEDLAKNIATALNAGFEYPKHFEEVALFADKVGADIISDATCNILKWRFIEYTQKQCSMLGIPMRNEKIPHAVWDKSSERWLERTVKVPINIITRQPIILVPKCLLNDVPVISKKALIKDEAIKSLKAADDSTIGRNVTNEHIVRIVLNNPKKVQHWVVSQASRSDLKSYDFDCDVKGVYLWDKKPKEYAKNNPINTPQPTNESELEALLTRILEKFKNFIEKQDGWRMLWNDRECVGPEGGLAKNERAVQLIFLAIAQQYLQKHGVMIEEVAGLGRDPIVLSLGSGVRPKMLIEVKKGENGRFWNGLQDHLVSCLESAKSQEVWLVLVQFSNAPLVERRVQLLPGAVKRISQLHEVKMKTFLVNAQKPMST